MPSAIRDWLSSAQAAEVRGDKPEAIRLLRLAAKFYFEQRMTPRGEQMLRHIRRLEGRPGFTERRAEGLDDPPPAPTDEELGFVDQPPSADGDEGLGFGDELLALSGALPEVAEGRAQVPVAFSAGSLPRRWATQSEVEPPPPGAVGAPGASRSALHPAPADPSSPEDPQLRLGRTLPTRQATLADPRMDAWCSFCCRPRGEVGQLVAGPAGAFICGACVLLATELLGDEPEPGEDS